jgi:hypothetical protein
MVRELSIAIWENRPNSKNHESPKEATLCVLIEGATMLVFGAVDECPAVNALDIASKEEWVLHM